MKDVKRLVRELRCVNALPYQVRMASTLLAVNGIENALEFVAKIPTINGSSTAYETCLHALPTQVYLEFIEDEHLETIAEAMK